MKKAYKKPAMIVEWFTLSQTIAAGCADLSDYGSPTLNRMYLCGWDLNGATTIFLEGNDNCLLQIEDGSLDGVCYNAPVPGMQLFNS